MTSNNFNGHSMVGELRRVMVCSPRNAGWDDPQHSSRWRELGFLHPPQFQDAQHQHEALCRELEAAGLIVLADKGYTGAGDHVLTPYRGRNKPASQKAANSAHAKLRAPGERANAQLKHWGILHKLRCCPGAPGRSPKPSTSSKPARSPDEKRSWYIAL